MRATWAALAGASALLAGCSTVAPDGTRTSYHLGLTKVISRPASEGVALRDVETLGTWIDAGPGGGAGLGYRHGREILVPTDCRIAIIADDADEAERLAALIGNELEERGELCALPDSEYLPSRRLP